MGKVIPFPKIKLDREEQAEQLTDDIILALGEDSRDIRYQSLGDDVV